MIDSSGRRIKRSIIIRQDTIKFLSDSELNKLEKIELLTDYIQLKKKEVIDFNNNNKVDKSVMLNGRNLTNIGAFRKYVDLYLHNHSAINKDMMIMARQLQPTNHGIPLEVYAFSKDKRWENYEYITSDIFDHLLSAIKYFDLEVFESPNSKSFK
jgi:miniconductance mechanosensitive channel